MCYVARGQGDEVLQIAIKKRKQNEKSFCRCLRPRKGASMCASWLCEDKLWRIARLGCEQYGVPSQE